METQTFNPKALLTSEETQLITVMTIGSKSTGSAIKSVVEAIQAQGKSLDFAISTTAKALASVKEEFGRGTQLDSSNQFVFVGRLGQEYKGDDTVLKNQEFYVSNCLQDIDFSEQLQNAQIKHIITEHLDKLTDSELDGIVGIKQSQAQNKIGVIPNL